MGQKRSPGNPTTRRYSESEKEHAVRAVRSSTSRSFVSGPAPTT